MPAGWGYFDIADPTGGNLNVSQVERPDGLYLKVGDNVWNTVQNITSNGFVTAENDLHLLDYNATAVTITYDVTYTNPNAVTPQITAAPGGQALHGEHGGERPSTSPSTSRSTSARSPPPT